jgi:hypothetical protein
MAKAVHIKASRDGWTVVREGSDSASSVHRTQAEAAAAGRRLALKSGGAEVVVHRTDGRIRSSDTIRADAIDERKRGDQSTRHSRPRAPRSEGPRTTLRLPEALAAVADRLAHELNISRNDALLRLATRGARLYEQQWAIAARQEERWAAVVPGVVDIDVGDLPSPDEARDTILGARDADARTV